MNLLLSFLIATAIASQTITVVLAKPEFNLKKVLDDAVEYAGDAVEYAGDTFDNGLNFLLNKIEDNQLQLNITADYASDDSVKFYCVKNPNSTFEEVKLNDSKVEQQLDLSKPINFIIHGFMAKIEPMYATAEAWIANCNDECNVCVIDWRPLSGTFIEGEVVDIINSIPDFLKYKLVAMHHTVTTSNSIHRFMEFLINNKMNIEKVSIAGHSLGAHIAGFVGAKFNGAIKAIYGLDPAGLGFQRAPRESKLNADDARYVQCIYTDTNFWGSNTVYGDGHGNFFMNENGEDQPGCEMTKMDITCDHSRAHEYFKESMNKENIFEGVECKVPNNQNRTDRIGIHSKMLNGTFCVGVNEEPPYAKGKIANSKSNSA